MSEQCIGQQFLDTLQEVAGRMHYAKEMGIPNEELRVRHRVLKEALADLNK